MRRLVPPFGEGPVGRFCDGAVKGLAVGLLLAVAGGVWLTATADVRPGDNWWERLHPAAPLMMRWLPELPWIAAVAGGAGGLVLWAIRAIRRNA